jgi:hypothetical protein
MTGYDSALKHVPSIPVSTRDKMTFKVTIPGIDEKYLWEIQGRHGLCHIGQCGGMPELEHGFYYGDEQYEFCFYARKIYRGSEFDIEVYQASVRRFAGPNPVVSRKDLDYIKANMEQFFATREFLRSRRPINQKEKLRILTISGGFN